MGVLAMLFRPLFATVLIGLNYNSNSCVIRVVKKRGNSIVEDISKEFKILNGELSADVVKYIKKIKTRYAFSYVAILSKTSEQMLVPGIKKNQFSHFGVNEKESKVIKISGAFVTMLKDDIIRYQRTFRNAKGLDFLFSPFILLFFKSKSFIGDNPKLFVLQETETLATFIATRKAILYGSFLSMNTGESVTNVTTSLPPSLSDASDVLVATTSTSQGIDDLNTELGGIDEELADFDNFNFDNIGGDSGETISGNSAESEESGAMESLQDLGRSTSIINLLQATLKDFYHNSLYEGDFVEEIVLFDCYGISSQAVDNIRSNLMIDLSIVATDLAQEITNLIQIELDS